MEKGWGEEERRGEWRAFEVEKRKEKKENERWTAKKTRNKEWKKGEKKRRWREVRRYKNKRRMIAITFYRRKGGRKEGVGLMEGRHLEQYLCVSVYQSRRGRISLFESISIRVEMEKKWFNLRERVDQRGGGGEGKGETGRYRRLTHQSTMNTDRSLSDIPNGKQLGSLLLPTDWTRLNQSLVWHSIWY